MSEIKQELMEHLIRVCVKEVLKQVNEADDETVGAAAPPADGQGTADQPEVPKAPEGQPPESPSQPETPPAPTLKGLVLVNPRDKSKLQKLNVKGASDAELDRNLHRIAAPIAGSNIKIALATLRMVKDSIKNPNSSTYLYFGKYDPNSDELFLMADKSLQIAKDSSVQPYEITGTPNHPIGRPEFNPVTADTADYAKHMAAAGRVEPTPVDGQVREQIKRIVEQILDRK